MNGCSYLQKKFTLPASNMGGNMTAMRYDLAVLTKAEWIAKYKSNAHTYNELLKDIGA